MRIILRSTRFTVRWIGAVIAKYYLAVLVGVTLSLGVVWLVPGVWQWWARLYNRQTVGVVGRFTQSDIPMFIQRQISFGLTTLADNGLPQPGIARSWSISADGKEYTFFLDEQLRWHDGSPVVSADIKYNFQGVVVEYPDTRRVVLRLREPYAPLLTAVSRPVFKHNLVGVGDYQVKSLRRNGQYIERLALLPRKSGNPALTYRVYASDSQVRLAFSLGEIKRIVNLTESGQLVSWPRISVTSASRDDQYVGVFLNTAQLDKNLRQALAYATNKTRWSNRVYGPILANSWAYNSEIKRYDYDLEHAKQLLKKAEQVPEIITISTAATYQSIAQDIKTDWEKLGLKAEIKLVDSLPDAYQVLIAVQTTPADPDQYNLWHSTRSTNITHLDNKRIDKLLEDGRATIDTDKRAEIYKLFQKYLLEDCPVIFLFRPAVYNISRQ